MEKERERIGGLSLLEVMGRRAVVTAGDTRWEPSWAWPSAPCCAAVGAFMPSVNGGGTRG